MMIHIYYMNIDCDCSNEQSQTFYGRLPVERKKRLERLKNPELWKKHILAASMLQYCLGQELHIPMETVCFSYGMDGKPYLDCEQIRRKLLQFRCSPPQYLNTIFFNMSHSGKYAVLVVSDCETGIDVEYRRKGRLSVAKRCFCEREYADIISQKTKMEQENCFLQYWTMKEAYIKRTGKGLKQPLNSFCIDRRENALSRVQDEEVYFVSFYLEKDYCISVCSDCPEELKKCDRQHIRFVTLQQML